MTIVSGYNFQLYLITILFTYAGQLYYMPIPAEGDETTEPTPYPNCGSSKSSERFGEIRRLLLSKLAGIEDADATEWSDLCRGAHGLLASATHLYQAVGVDVTIYVRVPDTKKLRSDDRRYQDFLDFFSHTVRKNASYGIHSVYRMLYEDRVDKLKHRMGVEFDADATADLTASWMISGPTASTFRDDVQ